MQQVLRILIVHFIAMSLVLRKRIKALSHIDYKAIAQKISGLTSDSRAVKQGYLFAAIKGAAHDGNDYIDQAVENGAIHVLTDNQAQHHDGAEILHSDNVREGFAHLAANFYQKQPAHIAAVTGTNGKTSVAHFVDQIWKALGDRSDFLGTLSGKLTTADPVALHETLADKVDDGVTHLIMEASSHGLDQYRLDGVNVDVAAFTNLSRDHLDYHGDMAAYLAAKSRLFSDVLNDDGVAVLNADISEYSALSKICADRGIDTLSYGYQGKDITLISCVSSAQGLDISVSVLGQPFDVSLPLIGEFQAMNILCAVGVVLAQDPERVNDVVLTLSSLQSVPGRLQSVPRHPKDAGVFVDFAHTPDALETVLKAVRPHCSGDVWCVFGAGGNRDAGKRSLMGAATAQYADYVIVTDDNPRSEDPSTIRAAIMVGAPEAKNIAGRREAIQFSIQNLQRGDVLVIAGKGHEQGQIFADHVDPFNDAEEAQIAISNLSTQSKEKTPKEGI
jgi:UDP-N-acetylmuramoyl-L-alanyl-D-glutamate--2,6-diaminopimelate ligase